MTEPDTPAPAPLGDNARLLAEAAQLEAKSLGHSFVGMEHILLALLADPVLAAAAAEKGAPDRDELRQRLASSGAPRSVATGGEFGLSPQARRLLEGTGSLNRAELLERIVGNPRGPLAKLLGRESRVARSRRRTPRKSRSGSKRVGGSRRESKRVEGSRSGSKRVEGSRRGDETALREGANSTARRESVSRSAPRLTARRSSGLRRLLLRRVLPRIHPCVRRGG